MARVLVTGGAGFIGSHTTERLVHAGHRVTVVDNLSSGAWGNLASVAGDVERINADVRDRERLQGLVRATGCEAIIHLAAWASVIASVEHPVDAHAVNVGGTLNVLEAARAAGVPRMVLASSTAVYGRTPPLPTGEDAPLRPISPYAAHKAESELLGMAYRAAFGIAVVALRYFNVYGRRQPADSPYSGVVAVLARRLEDGASVTIHGDGEQTRDFIHVSDVAAVNAHAALGPDPGTEPINVGSGRSTSVLSLLAEMRALLHTDAAIRFGPERPGDVRHSRADISRLRGWWGSEPRVSLREGLLDLLGS